MKHIAMFYECSTYSVMYSCRYAPVGLIQIVLLFYFNVIITFLVF